MQRHKKYQDIAHCCRLRAQQKCARTESADCSAQVNTSRDMYYLQLAMPARDGEEGHIDVHVLWYIIY